MNNEVKLPCKIGDTIYVVEDYNHIYDKCKFYETKYNSKIVIKSYCVEAFIIDNEGIFIAEGSHDGFNKFTTYHDITLESYEDCKIFLEEKDAIEFVKSIRR